MMDKQRKRGFRWWMIPAGLLALVAVVLLGGRLWFRLPVLHYYRASAPAFDIPDILGTYVPQGLAYAPDEDHLLLSGYARDGGPSPLYVVERATGKMLKRVTFTLADGKTCTSHCGGLALHDRRIYLCDSETASLRVFRYADLLAAKDGDALVEIGAVPLVSGDDHIGPAFVTAGADGLIVGEFYIAKSYETLRSHYVDDHHALAVMLPYDSSEVGVSATPVAAYSLPDKAQGMCFDDEGRMYISESWGASSSVIEVFIPGQPDREITVLGVTVPLTMLNDKNRVTSVTLPPMSEEIVIVGDKMYVNCESASTKYFFGLLNGAQKLYATDMSLFKNK